MEDRLRGYWLVLGVLLLVALGTRIGYLAAQPAGDPTFAHPAMDGEYYTAWAHALLDPATPAPEGAFYRAPLYPYWLAAVLGLTGGNIAFVYFLQHLLVLLAAVFLGLAVRDEAGDLAALCAVAGLLLYHPSVFFASRPLGEALALALAAAALFSVTRAGWSAPVVGGVLVGAATLARPNLLLLVPLWGILLVARRRLRDGFAFVVLAGLAILPAAWHNYRESGHFVPVSANAGLTFFHGNGPGAGATGVLPPGASGNAMVQRAEATALARAATGRALDPVEADRYWGREALRARLADPAGTLRLVGTRAGLLIANPEMPLDDTPGIDGNTWRFATPLPFAFVFALAAAGVFARGRRGFGGPFAASLLAAAGASPLLFYVTGRYRFLFAAVLCVPAGIGAASLLRAQDRGRLVRTVAAGILAFALSWLFPATSPYRTGTAVALANRADAWKELGGLDAARADLERALALDAGSGIAWYNLGVLEETQQRYDEAERAYRRAMETGPGRAEPVLNLGRLVLFRHGRPEDAARLVSEALERHPARVELWRLLLSAHAVGGDRDAMEEAFRTASSRGVRFDPEFLRTIGLPSGGE